MLYPGLYEQVINNALNRELAEIPEARKSTAPIDTAEAAKVLAQYLTDVVQKGLENVQDNGGGIEAQIQLANQIVTTIQNTTQEADFAALSVDQRAEQLLALLQQNDPRLATGKSAKDLDRPETSIAQSSLFTGAIHEPQMYTELKKEIVSAESFYFRSTSIHSSQTFCYFFHFYRLVESNRISSTSDEVDAFIESAGEHRYQTNNGDNTGYRITHFPSFEEWEVYVLQPVGCKWSGKSDVIIFLGCIVENDPGNEDRTEQ